MIDERIAKMMEAWDFAQFSDINLEPHIKQILYDGLQGVQEMVYGKKTNVEFNYDLSEAPSGSLQLLTAGMTRRIGEVTSVATAKEQGVIAWAPVAERVRYDEVRLGHIAHPRR